MLFLSGILNQLRAHLRGIPVKKQVQLLFADRFAQTQKCRPSTKPAALFFAVVCVIFRVVATPGPTTLRI